MQTCRNIWKFPHREGYENLRELMAAQRLTGTYGQSNGILHLQKYPKISVRRLTGTYRNFWKKFRVETYGHFRKLTGISVQRLMETYGNLEEAVG